MVCELWPEAGRRTCLNGVDDDGVAGDGAETDAANADVLADVDDGAVDRDVLAAGTSAASFVSISAASSGVGGYEADTVCELWPEAERKSCPDGADDDGADVDGAETDAANADVLADVNDGAAGISIDLVTGNSARLVRERLGVVRGCATGGGSTQTPCAAGG